MKKITTDKHFFALYYPDVQRHAKSSFIITDELMIHRIVRVLRFEKNDEFILFGNELRSTVILTAVDKHSITVQVLDTQENLQFTPLITTLIPVLKREALQEAVYNAVECGANEIQLMITEKTQRAWGGAKEQERLEKIIIAASEQAKHFTLAHLKAPKAFNELLQNTKKQPLIFFDSQGEHLSQTIKTLHGQKHTHLHLMFGPEADLSLAEKETLKKHNALCTQLTPTILRAPQAVAVGVGAIRSFLAHDDSAQ